MLRLIATKVALRSSFQQIPSLLFCTYNNPKKYNKGEDKWDKRRERGDKKFKPEVDHILNLDTKKARRENE